LFTKAAAIIIAPDAEAAEKIFLLIKNNKKTLRLCGEHKILSF
jgi:hypothetical protein